MKFQNGRIYALYEVSNGVRSTRNEDGGIVLDVEKGKVFRLNPVGTLIWEKLRQQRTQAEVVREISENFGISPGIVDRDVSEFLAALEALGLLRRTKQERV